MFEITLLKVVIGVILYLAVGQLVATKIIADYEWEPKTPIKRFLLFEACAIFGLPCITVLILAILVFSIVEIPYNIFVEDTDP
ncbi:MAG: hypothetical protein A2Y82_00450 [Candidatus Buchananbacteria bacterium RBG_13_36_9]|uniref:Uncharacterized protein n=1 Tax=Candidatus Buchananbacteria bacterium RBG_13_36_9 TaxID=1797530 RepID=A0A1G1XQA5_9BACT|nr:MAG: hypothetical protein A2Y82_00450 [Candidatus Buchananbacteria bacterium RBG_13_36_9]